ncbi:MAG: substrate-binding domain-containing protein [Ilumatobacteraceae bacterium]
MTTTRITRTAITLIAAMGLVAAGCGSDGDSSTAASDSSTATSADQTVAESTNPGTPVAPSPYCDEACQDALALQADPASIECTVGLSWNTAGHPFGATSISRSESSAAAMFPNMTLLTGHGEGDSLKQTAQIEDLLVKGIDVLIVSPTDAAALAPVVKRAADEGVKIIASDRNVDTAVDSYIGADNVLSGKVAGEHIVDLLGGSGKVAVLQGALGASPTIDRQAGFLEALDGSDIEIVADQTANYDRAEGLQVMEDYLQRFGSGEIDAVFAHNDEMALGAIQAIEEAGRADEIAVVGIDGQESALDAIENGSYAATVVYPIPVPEHIIAAAKLCAGEPLPERIVTSATLVTLDNVADVRGTTF